MMIPYCDNNYFLLFPRIPTMNEKPPTVYSILQSIVNFGKEEQRKIKDLAKTGRTTIFDFEYPLTDKINKETFECMILNHFLMRRIGFDTVTAFKIQLNVKLNEIMPMYNKMFNAMDNWDIFNDGEKTTRNGTDNRTTDTTNTSTTTNTLQNTSQTTNEETSDRRQSELPQSEIDNVKNASYLTNYNFDTNNSNSNDTSNSNGTSENNSSANTKDDNIYNETIIKTPADKIAIYKEFQENLKTIYGMIFKDLDCLFYQLV